MEKKTELLSIDVCVRAFTAFRSWSEMRDDMRRTGYVPTLRTDRRARTEQGAIRKIAAACLADKLRVYLDGNMMGPQS